MSDTGHTPDGAKAKFVRDAMTAELKYRRDKMWKLFSWVNTLLTGIIGGVIALKTQPDRPFNLTPMYRIALTIAVLGLAIHACLWLQYNWEKTKDIWDLLEAHSRNNEINFVKFGRPGLARYPYAVAVLGLAAVIAIWV
jgi:hypothetical protein